MTDQEFIAAVPLAGVRAGGMRAVLVAGREVLVVHTRDGGVFALDNVCTHAFARMCEGRLKGSRLFCPLHGASFDAGDGRVLGGPATLPLRTYEARVKDGQVEVRVPVGP